MTEISKQMYWYKNFCSEIQVGLVALGWLGEAPGVSGELSLVLCPSPGVYFPFCCWGLQLGFVLLQQGSELKQWQLLVELFLCASRMLTVSSGKRFCSWACCLYHIKVKWLQNAVCKSLIACVPRKSAVVRSGRLFSVTWRVTWIFLQYVLITCWLKIKCEAALLARWGPDVLLCYATLTSELFLLWIAFLTCWGLFLKHFLLFFFFLETGKALAVCVGVVCSLFELPVFYLDRWVGTSVYMVETQYSNLHYYS